MSDFNVTIKRDTASKPLSATRQALSDTRMNRQVGKWCVDMTRGYLNNLPPNKQGWPSRGFYAASAKGTAFTWDANKAVITIDNPDAPGALKHQFYGGRINMKDRLLTIPARQEFYGQKASQIQGLKFVKFASGAMALVIGDEGANKFNWKTGRFRTLKGAGVRSQALVAFWLKDHVDQDAKPEVIPTTAAYAETSKDAVMDFLDQAERNASV